MIETLRKPQLAKHLTAEISQHNSIKSAAYNVHEIASKPIFQSVHREVSRLRMAQCRIYSNKTEDIALDDRWMLPKGNSAICFSHDMATNTAVWANARARTVERPLEEFWAERFLIPDGLAPSTHRKQQSKDIIESGKFSMEGLELLAPAFGDEQLGLGRDYAKAMQAATLSVLLSNFEIQLCDPEATDAVITPMREAAYGAVRPLEGIAVRIRKRKAY
jgi:hypothetical protein